MTSPSDVTLGSWLESLSPSQVVEDYNNQIRARFSPEEKFRFFWMRKWAEKENRT